MVALSELRLGRHLRARLSAFLSLRAAARGVPSRRIGLCEIGLTRSIMTGCRSRRTMNVQGHPNSKAARWPSLMTSLAISRSLTKRSAFSTRGSGIFWMRFGGWKTDHHRRTA